MQKLELVINGKHYHIACDTDQRDRIRQLSEEVDMRANMIAQEMPQTHASNILMMTCLHLADELYETRQEAGKLREQMLVETHDLHDVLPNAARSSTSPSGVDEAMDALSDSLESLSRSIEKL